MSLNNQPNFAPFNLSQPDKSTSTTTSTSTSTASTTSKDVSPQDGASIYNVPTSQPNILPPTNVLNNNNQFSYSDYNTVMLANEANKLQNLNNIANNELLKTANSQRFYNLSLNDVVNKTVLTVVAIFVDLLQLKKKSSVDNNINYQDVAKIFIGGDRMIYFGVFLIFLSLLFMVVFLSS
jgi:hypothetical protein